MKRRADGRGWDRDLHVQVRPAQLEQADLSVLPHAVNIPAGVAHRYVRLPRRLLGAPFIPSALNTNLPKSAGALSNNLSRGKTTG